MFKLNFKRLINFGGSKVKPSKSKNEVVNSTELKSYSECFYDALDYNERVASNLISTTLECKANYAFAKKVYDQLSDLIVKTEKLINKSIELESMSDSMFLGKEDCTVEVLYSEGAVMHEDCRAEVSEAFKKLESLLDGNFKVSLRAVNISQSIYVKGVIDELTRAIRKNDFNPLLNAKLIMGYLSGVEFISIGQSCDYSELTKIENVLLDAHKRFIDKNKCNKTVA